MSTILHGLSETKSHAPLSSGQTVAVFQQLHSDILNAMQLIENQRKGLERQGNGLTKLVNEVAVMNTGLEDLRQDFKAMSERLDAAGSRTGDSLALGEKLKKAMQLAREDINFLREGQQTTNTNVEVLRSDLKTSQDDLKALHADIDDVVKAALRSVQEKSDQTLLGLRALSVDHEKTKTGASQQRARLQTTADELKAARMDLDKLESTVGKQGSTLADTAKKQEETRVNLEITNAVVFKMNETREATQMDIAELKEGAKAATVRMDSLGAEQAKTARELSLARDNLVGAQAAVSEARLEVGRVGADVMALLEGQAKATGNIGRLANEISKVKNLAASTKQNLDVTNSMVLPNLGPGDMSAAGTQSGFEGSRSLGYASPGGFGKTLSPSTTPRRRREASWTARNIGIVPDRMSWI